MRVLLISSYYPPTIGGSSTTSANLARLLRSVASVEVLSNDPYFYGGNQQAKPPERVNRHEISAMLPRYRGPYSQFIRRSYRRVAAGKIQSRLAAIVRSFRPTHIIGIFPDIYFFTAAEAVARACDIPFLPYLYDLPVAEDLKTPLPQVIDVLNRSQAVFSLTAGVQGWLADLGIPSELLPHVAANSLGSVGRKQEGKTGPAPMPESVKQNLDLSKPFLLHTGVVENLQKDGLQSVLRAFLQLNLPDYQIVLTTPFPEDTRDALGEDLASGICINTFSTEEVHALQQHARLLLSVLPFDPNFRSLGNTCFPTKIVEYLQTGVPIFLHAPPESALNSHAASYGYAFRSNSPNPAEIAPLLKRALEDDQTRRDVLQAADNTLHREFSAQRLQGKLLAQLEQLKTGSNSFC